MKGEEIRRAVRESYGKIAMQDVSDASYCGSTGCGCGVGSSQYATSKAIGYSDVEITAAPDGANLGLGCGNPTALALLKEGEIVLDLGSGGGFDCFLAANKVGKSGRVIGVDMTAEMIEKARENARKGDYKNVEFRLGEIENLPVADNTVDVLISNCVINLSPDKKRVYEEAFRILKPGGRVMVSDIALLKELSVPIKGSIAAYVGCVAGATTKEEYLATITAAGFKDVEIVNEVSVKGLYNSGTVEKLVAVSGISPDMVREAEESIISMQIQAIKPN
ncbi:arsenite methyltransferase [Chloroflexota bacterium]